MYVDREGWLVAEPGDPTVKRFPTVRTCPLAVPAPIALVWHYTGGRGGSGYAEALATRTQSYRRGIDRPASWHVLIEAADGAILQSASFLVGTWHVGRPGVVAGRRFSKINRVTIGCELENAGRLRRIAGRWYCWPFYEDPEAPADERRPDPRCAMEPNRSMVAPGDGTFDAFTKAQEVSATKLVEALVARFGWRRQECAYGHVDFDAPRKEDPGPLWRGLVLPRVLDAVFGGAPVAVSQPTAPASAPKG